MGEAEAVMDYEVWEEEEERIATPEEMKEEAIKRMNAIGIYGQTVNQFWRSGLISSSEPPLGACFWINENENEPLTGNEDEDNLKKRELTERIRAFEKRFNCLVYHVIHSFSSLGETFEYLYVSQHMCEWEDDNEMLEEHMTVAYVDVMDFPPNSEIGTIGIALTPAAGVKRTW